MNFTVNFNVLLSKYIVHPLVEIKKILIISRCTVQPRKLTALPSTMLFKLCPEMRARL